MNFCICADVSILLAQSLEEAAQGKEVNMEHLRHEVNQCLPVSVAKKKNEAQNPVIIIHLTNSLQR